MFEGRVSTFYDDGPCGHGPEPYRFSVWAGPFWVYDPGTEHPECVIAWDSSSSFAVDTDDEEEAKAANVLAERWVLTGVLP